MNNAQKFLMSGVVAIGMGAGGIAFWPSGTISDEQARDAAMALMLCRGDDCRALLHVVDVGQAATVAGQPETPAACPGDENYADPVSNALLRRMLDCAVRENAVTTYYAGALADGSAFVEIRLTRDQALTLSSRIDVTLSAALVDVRPSKGSPAAGRMAWAGEDPFDESEAP